VHQNSSNTSQQLAGESKRPSPWLYVITLYFPFGLLQAGLAVNLPNNLLKLLEFSNEQIGLISGIGLVASLRFLIAPWLDGATTKRKLSIITLTVSGFIAIGMSAVTLIAPHPMVFLWTMVALLFGVAIVGAAHETAADGYYIRALDPKRQAEFIGIKTASIRIGSIFATTGLLLLATRIADHFGATGVDSVDKVGFHYGFGTAFGIVGAIVLAIALYNRVMIPVIPEDQPVKHERFAILDVLRDYFMQKRVFLIVAFIVLYRFGEGFLVLKHPFYLDSREAGGLGIDAADLAYISILAELPWMIVGGILGGYIIKWFGLRRVFIPLALCINIPNLLYYWLAATQPTATFMFLGEDLNIALLGASSVEALGYGMSFSAMFYYMHITATESGRNKTSILAVSFAIMNVGWYLPGMLSGFVQSSVGYTGLFILSSTVGLAALTLIPFLPMPSGEATGDERKT
jgi:MFS transporter, PAT family, beta-lactamase induction signal transducer AmpG